MYLNFTACSSGGAPSFLQPFDISHFGKKEQGKCRCSQWCQFRSIVVTMLKSHMQTENLTIWRVHNLSASSCRCTLTLEPPYRRRASSLPAWMATGVSSHLSSRMSPIAWMWGTLVCSSSFTGIFPFLKNGKKRSEETNKPFGGVKLHLFFPQIKWKNLMLTYTHCYFFFHFFLNNLGV